MSKSYSPDIIKYVDNIRDYWKGVIGGKNKIFLNHLVSNTTNTSKDITIIPKEFQRFPKLIGLIIGFKIETFPMC